MSSLPCFFSVPRAALAQLSAANTARDGTGTVVDLITGAATGTRVDDIEMCAAGTVTAGVVRLFLFDGTSTRLLREILVTATVPSTTLAAWNTKLTDLGIILASASWKLRAATNNAEVINVAVTKAGDA